MAREKPKTFIPKRTVRKFLCCFRTLGTPCIHHLNLILKRVYTISPEYCRRSLHAGIIIAGKEATSTSAEFMYAALPLKIRIVRCYVFWYGGTFYIYFGNTTLRTECTREI